MKTGIMRNFLVLGFCVVATDMVQASCGTGAGSFSGTYGGYDFYQGLAIQVDLKSGKKLPANYAKRVNNAAACTRLCEQDANCTAVTFTAQDQRCHAFAAYDFATRRQMGLSIYNGGVRSTISALVRQGYRGPLCR